MRLIFETQCPFGQGEKLIKHGDEQTIRTPILYAMRFYLYSYCVFYQKRFGSNFDQCYEKNSQIYKQSDKYFKQTFDKFILPSYAKFYCFARISAR